MTREHERLDRLMGLLASEGGAGRDMREAVMRRLERSGVVRRGRRAAWWLASLAAIAVAGWVGFDAWSASRRAADLGEIGRRGASWIVPQGGVERAMPARFTPKPRRAPTQAVAPWGRT